MESKYHLKKVFAAVHAKRMIKDPLYQSPDCQSTDYKDSVRIGVGKHGRPGTKSANSAGMNIASKHPKTIQCFSGVSQADPYIKY